MKRLSYEDKVVSKRPKVDVKYGLPSPDYENIRNSSSSESLSNEFVAKPNKLDELTHSDYSELKPLSPITHNEYPTDEKKEAYRKHLHSHGILQFLREALPEESTEEDINVIFSILGYEQVLKDKKPKKVKQMIRILIKHILQDKEMEELVDKEISNQCIIKVTLDEFMNKLRCAKNVMVITGAGISTSLGIPDFRSFKGLYAQLEYLKLPDPQQVFDIRTFRKDPSIFYQIANRILPSSEKYSLCHSFIKKLQDMNKLLRNYTQNIDNLETYAGVLQDLLVQCHGSFNTASCITCKARLDGSAIFQYIREKKIPLCSICHSSDNSKRKSKSYGTIKPDITFFGEKLPQRYFEVRQSDVNNCDMVIVIGTSLNVQPVSNLIEQVPANVPKILINRDVIRSESFSLSLIGLCDDVTTYILNELNNVRDEGEKFIISKYDEQGSIINIEKSKEDSINN